MILGYKYGRLLPSDKIHLIDDLWKLRQTKPVWEVITAVIEYWQKTHPSQWKAYLVRLENIRETRKETKVGSSQWRGVSRDDKKHDAITSYLLDIPEWIVFCLRKLYNAHELPMDKRFFQEFARRFPIFKIREKI